MTASLQPERVAAPADPAIRPALLAMLEARSVAIVGASARSGSFGARMVAEAAKSVSKPVIYPVNPRYPNIGGRHCYASLADLPSAPDLVLLGVPNAALEAQLTLAAQVGGKSAVIFGSPPAASAAPASRIPRPQPSRPGAQPPLRQRLVSIAQSAGMELCGAGCMGFANVARGLRAMGYIEPDPLPAGPVALVTHSGSVFSALLRTRRAFGFTLAVSSGQEIVTAAPSYLEYALTQPGTKMLALVLEAIRQPAALRRVLARAAGRDLPVILLTAGNSPSGQAMVAAHSGALAGSDAGWEALCRAYGMHRVADLAELADALELFTLATRRRPAAVRAARGGAGRGLATVHDSGLERAHAADIAHEAGVPYAEISPETKARIADLLDPGLTAANPLDVWGTGANTRELFGECLSALADDPAADVVALAVDLVTELDGDDSYPQAMLDAASRTDKPLAVLTNVPSAIDPGAAELLRASGIPVLEGMRTGLRALGHLLDHLRGGPAPASQPPDPDSARLRRATTLLARSPATAVAQLELLAEYGINVARTERVTDLGQALTVAGGIGYPIVLKTDNPAVAHKSDVGGVVLGIADEAALTAAYADLAARLGPAALVCESVPAGVELALGLVTDPDLGPLIVVGAGGTLVELIADRAVALPPLTAGQARGMLSSLKVSKLLAGVRGAPPASLDAISAAVVAVAELASELGGRLEALDINPLICGPATAIAADALFIPA
ncbi:MAG TPA: acetate--CoA ligase family protein [Streptosporangiaceae bacterium]|nr:acetate--CoA ligase family protein [Streptosporangiaceae bacterium]